MRLHRALLTAAFLTAPVLAMAQPVDGPYIGAGAGLHIPQEPNITTGGALGSGRLKLDENYGFNSDLSLGYGFGNGLRLEVEGDFLRSTVRHVLGTPFPTASSGTVRTWGAMGNAIYDMDVGVPYLYPYVGLGAGYQWTKLNPLTVVAPGAVVSSSSQGSAFAWQAIAGVSVPIESVPGLSLTADYRFMDILGGEKYGAAVTAGGVSAPATLKMHNQFDHELTFGIRYAFYTPAPPAPAPAPAAVAAPAPAPARSYLVFFDWDKADLTDKARQVIGEAAQNSTHVQLTRIEVNGYTDTSGTPKYNQGLSVRRANAVAGELVRDGVPRNAIAIQGFGETHLLVPTGAGVREPQNRRVEIILR